MRGKDAQYSRNKIHNVSNWVTERNWINSLCSLCVVQIKALAKIHAFVVDQWVTCCICVHTSTSLLQCNSDAVHVWLSDVCFSRKLSESKQADIRKECLKLWTVSADLTERIEFVEYRSFLLRYSTVIHCMSIPRCQTRPESLLLPQTQRPNSTNWLRLVNIFW